MPDSVKARISLQPSSSATDAATRVRLRVIGVPGPAGATGASERRASVRRGRMELMPCSSARSAMRAIISTASTG